MFNILMFGTGGLARYLTEHIKADVNLLAYVDSFNFDTSIDGKKVISPKEICEYDFDFIVIGFSSIRKGKAILAEIGVPLEKIVGCSFNGPYDYANNPYQVSCDQYLKKELSLLNFEKIFNIKTKKYFS